MKISCDQCEMIDTAIEKQPGGAGTFMLHAMGLVVGVWGLVVMNPILIVIGLVVMVACGEQCEPGQTC